MTINNSKNKHTTMNKMTLNQLSPIAETISTNRQMMTKMRRNRDQINTEIEVVAAEGEEVEEEAIEVNGGTSNQENQESKSTKMETSSSFTRMIKCSLNGLSFKRKGHMRCELELI